MTFLIFNHSLRENIGYRPHQYFIDNKRLQVILITPNQTFSGDKSISTVQIKGNYSSGLYFSSDWAKFNLHNFQVPGYKCFAL